MMLSSHQNFDLAGPVWLEPTPHQVRLRITHLVNRFLSEAQLHNRLQDLPQQFAHPWARPWGAVQWSQVHPEQWVGLAPEVVQAILIGAINTEAPIRDYTQASRQYLEPIHGPMARFVGGQLDADGELAEMGLWEREERQHTPALQKLYACLIGAPIVPVPHQARPYYPPQDPQAALYRHGLHRIATEYGATCLYLWLMAHATGPLQAILAELLQDEINHMTKFWGFGRWVFPESSLPGILLTLGEAMHQRWRQPGTQSSLVHTLNRMLRELGWSHWTWHHRMSFFFTLDQVMRRLWRWDSSLSAAYLNSLFGGHPETTHALEMG